MFPCAADENNLPPDAVQSDEHIFHMHTEGERALHTATSYDE